MIETRTGIGARVNAWVKRAVAAAPRSWLRAYHARRGPVILMYHGVSTEDRLHWLGRAHKHVPMDVFVTQLRTLAALRRVIGLSELVERLRRGANVAGTAAITFDDGFRNNVTRVAPVLLEHRLPATFFLTTGYVGTDRAMWVDRLDRAVLSLVGRRDSIEILGQRIDLGSAAQAAEGYRAAKRAVKSLPLPQAEARVEEVESLAAVGGLRPAGPDEVFMSWDEARSLASSGFELGAHTVNHPILSRISFEEARDEILESRRRIEAEVGSCSPVFCYPNGKPEDYTPAIVELCRSHFQAALSTQFGRARPTELFELRRIAPTPVDGAEALIWQLLKASHRDVE